MEAPKSGYDPWDTSAGNRFAHNSPVDHTGPIWIATILCILYTVGVLILRLYIKRRVLGWDDYIVTASSAAALGQYSIVCYALTSGLGRPLRTAHNPVLLGKLIFSTQVLHLTAQYLAKLSVLAIIYRIFCRNSKILTIFCGTATGIAIIGGIAAVVLNTVGCPSALFTNPHCSNQITRWIIITAMDIATEVIMLLMLSYMAWQLQMSMKRKLHVITAFAFRLSVIVTSVFFLEAWQDYTKRQVSPLFITHTIIWQQVLLAVCVISATLPSLKAFLMSLSARWGQADMSVYGTLGTGNKGLGPSGSNSNRPQTSRCDIIPGAYTGNNCQIEMQIYTSTREGDGASRASTSGGSQDIMIKKNSA